MRDTQREKDVSTPIDIKKEKSEAILSSTSNTTESHEEIIVSGDWERSQYVVVREASEVDKQSLTVNLTHENNAAKILMFLSKTFAVSICASYITLLVAVTNTEVDKTMIKDTIPNLISSQIILLGGALGGYFLRSRQKGNKQKNND
jgi:hypothetical protein